jgi:hypothetical protein
VTHDITPATGTYGPLTRAEMGVTTQRIAQPSPIVREATSTDISLGDVINLFLALGIIPEEKEHLAYEALAALESA